MAPDTDTMAAETALPELGRPELLEYAEAIARERLVETDTVLGAMEQAVQTAALRKYGQDLEIQAEIDRASGAIVLKRVLEVADPVEDLAKQISVEEGQAREPGAKVGDLIYEPLPPVDVERLSAQTAKQVVYQKIREAERQRQYEEFKDRVGEVINGIVKRFEYGNVIVDLGRAEGFMRRDQTLAKENYRPGDRVRSYILDVREEAKGPQILLSRACNEFLVKLFAQEVPEIYDGIVEIRAAARDPGSRAKIAVVSSDPSIDPVGACVGMRGSRVQAVVGELQGERIDIIQWSPDTATFIVNALAPAEVTKVVLDEEATRVEVVVPEDQQSFAIGRRGQNVRLASKLTGWDIDILTEKMASERRQEELRKLIRMFVQTLDVDEVVAHLLVTEGFDSLEAVAYVPFEELAEIEGLREEVAQELRERAEAVIGERNEKLLELRGRLGVAEDAAVEGLTPAMLVVLGLNGVRTRDDVADLDVQELTETLKDKAALEKLRVFLQANGETMSAGMQLVDVALSEEEAGAVIMAARAHWFDGEEGPAAAGAAAGAPAAEEAQEEEAAAGEPEGEADADGKPAAAEAAAGAPAAEEAQEEEAAAGEPEGESDADGKPAAAGAADGAPAAEEAQEEAAAGEPEDEADADGKPAAAGAADGAPAAEEAQEEAAAGGPEGEADADGKPGDEGQDGASA